MIWVIRKIVVDFSSKRNYVVFDAAFLMEGVTCWFEFNCGNNCLELIIFFVVDYGGNGMRIWDRITRMNADFDLGE